MASGGIPKRASNKSKKEKRAANKAKNLKLKAEWLKSHPDQDPAKNTCPKVRTKHQDRNPKMVDHTQFYVLESMKKRKK